MGRSLNEQSRSPNMRSSPYAAEGPGHKTRQRLSIKADLSHWPCKPTTRLVKQEFQGFLKPLENQAGSSCSDQPTEYQPGLCRGPLVCTILHH